ncbi:hypothetical protein T05_11846 [Trichinella murrelli]|uniref:Uncharacterized protein n=1 Tax=Trichinella murrelli TaxID=144512 RepID=A0A0V0TZU5_9BILA|nr:hypothetical protein T05_11846 [Trichinella murrelli]
MKLVPFATRVRCTSVPLLITNSIVHHEFDVSSDGPLKQVDAVTFIIGTNVVSLIIRLWIMSSHEARTAANQCSPGVSMAFSSLSSVPLLITNIAVDATQIAFPAVLMFFLVTPVRNCEDESRILHDVHRNT